MDPTRPHRRGRAPQAAAHGGAWHLLLTAAAALALAAAAAPARAATAVVAERSGPGQLALVAALTREDVSRIVLAGDVSLGAALAGQATPLRINRNLTITSADPRAPRILDFDHALNALRLCAACTLTMLDLVMANDRSGAGPAIDALFAEPWARVVQRNVSRMRPACSPTAAAAAQSVISPRSPAFPGVQSSGATDAAFRGRAYPGSLTTGRSGAAVRVEKLYVDEDTWSGGYDLLMINSTRLCDQYLDPACLAKSSIDECVLQLMRAQASAARPGGAPAAVVAPAVTGSAALLAAAVVAAWAWRRRRRRRRAALEAALRNKEGAAAPPDERDPSSSDASWCIAHRLSPGAGGVEDTAGGAAALGGKEVGTVAALTAEIELGELIGAGSFGRVYRSRFRGEEAAVKVIEHGGGAEAEAVVNEAQLLLQMRHPNVVKALHVLQVTRGAAVCHVQGQAAAAASSSGSSSATGAAGSASCASSALTGSAASTSGGAPPGAGGAGGGGRGGAAAPGDGPPAGGEGGGAPLPAVDEAAVMASMLPLTVSQARLPPRHAGGPPRGGGAAAALTFIVQECCDAGTLEEVVMRLRRVAAPGGLAFEVNLRSLLAGAAEGLAHMHGQSIAHGDLNARNVLVTTAPSADGFSVTAKVSDFGLSRALTPGVTNRTTNTCGTLTHMAPERLIKGKMSAAGDVYAFGIMMWELWAGSSAFTGMHFGQVCQAVSMRGHRPDVPAGMPAPYAALMADCWAQEPHGRPAMADVAARLHAMPAPSE
ncbi:MAG: kinase-like domain-containing protein [Monoraphidium minutum]|nr:MAG: kinase-like domain-containing protein [Monoraphidium minutum]